ncbi:MAG: glycoside hydrolase family 25 protein [Prevotellaceae bacterium]|jgi:lysozyme|nr:glycoside hydrolase family 25 protein [Prevotellaceae bacterium]
MSVKRKKRLTKKDRYRHLIIVAAIIAVCSLFLFRSSEKGRIAFDIRIPAPYEICGIDVSHYQEKIDWKFIAQLRSGKDSLGILFAFIKATEGKSLKDPYFSYNWENAKKNKMLRGAYHYYKPNVNSKLQANNFIATVKMEAGDLPPVLDIEETGRFGNDNMRKGIKNWLTIIEKHYRVKPILYCYVDFYEHILSTDEFKDYPLWIAHYYEDELRVKEKWYFWQHSDKGRIESIRAKVDFNVFNGTFEELKALCKK